METQKLNKTYKRKLSFEGDTESVTTRDGEPYDAEKEYKKLMNKWTKEIEEMKWKLLTTQSPKRKKRCYRRRIPESPELISVGIPEDHIENREPRAERILIDESTVDFSSVPPTPERQQEAVAAAVAMHELQQ